MTIVPQSRARLQALNPPRTDWVLILVTAAILVIGTLLVWSSTAT